MSAHRTYFMDHSVLYLFSANIEFGMDFEQIGIVPGGLRVNVFCVQNTARIYNVLRERTVGIPGYPTVTGSIRWGQDSVFLGSDDVVVGRVRGTIQTDDGALLDTNYLAILPLAMGNFRAFAGGADLIGTAGDPVELRFAVTPTYESEAPKYRWLAEHQCVGFGVVQIVDGVFRRVSYDVYAMT
jgi:hypothetical protein